MKKPYHQFNLEERRTLERLLAVKTPRIVIAEKLNKSRSTIYREINRNSYHDDEQPQLNGYYAVVADREAAERRARNRKLIRIPKLLDAVLERLKIGWTPEQIAGRLIQIKSAVRVCHETIYAYIYSKEGLANKLWRYLHKHRARRRPRAGRRPQLKRFTPEVCIKMRPDEVAQRKQFGHWECDLIQFRKKFGKANVTSIVERVSRFTVLLRNNDRQSKDVMTGISNALTSLPFHAARSITFDRGTEFSAWPYLQAHLGVEVWFCDPQAPWQKGTVENTNLRTRHWLPRDTDPTALTNRYLVSICDRLNATPRKCLGYRTPAEVFKEKVLGMS